MVRVNLRCGGYMYHPEVAHYEPDPRHAQAVADDDAYRRQLAAAEFDPRTVDAIMHGETLDANGKAVPYLLDPTATTYYGTDAHVIGVGDYVHPLDIVAADIQAELHPDAGETYEGIREVMRRKVDLSKSSSNNPPRRGNPDAMGRPSSEQMHKRLLGAGRPCKGDKPRVHITARIDEQSRATLREAGEPLGEVLDMVATFISQGLTSNQIREALRNAAKSGIISPRSPDLQSVAHKYNDLPRCA
jgi:hypothetical protein